MPELSWWAMLRWFIVLFTALTGAGLVGGWH
jgi:hypothetical protein